MKRIQLILTFLAIAAMGTSIVAQTRYLDQVFTTTTRSTIVYGNNWTVLTLADTTLRRTFKQPLAAELIQPEGDTATKRPLVIYLHTGNFLPYPQNGSPSGTRNDSTALEISNRFARMGYVVINADYRLGWDPLNTTPGTGQIIRNYTLINASYRGIQDARTCVRYAKLNAATLKIDTSKILVIGQGTGGYIALGMATLDKYSKIVNTLYGPDKFKIPGATPTPMVIESVNGDINGIGNTAFPAGTGLPIPAGDSICSTNNLGASSNIQMCVNMGGALGDLSWLDANSKPILSFHAPYDPYAPYDDDILNVGTPSGPLPVVRVQGSFRVSLKADSLGINDAFARVKFRDPYNTVKQSRSTAKGLFPILGDAGNANDSSPWDFWASTNINNTRGLATNPTMSGAKARRYIDTIVGFTAPRACVVLDLPCKGVVTSTEDLLNSSTTKLFASPNPSKTAVTFESEIVNPMQAIQLFDLAGRQVFQAKVNSHNYTMPRNGLPSGMYVAKVKFEGGILTKKIVFED
jgi:Secretion system C-terminal sorting domain